MFFFKTGIFFFVFYIFCFQCFAEETKFKHLFEKDWLTIGGSYRVRYEMIDNFDINSYGTNKEESFLLS
jgi:hypothetical protein